MLAETVIIMMMKTNRRCLCWGTGKNHRQILFFSPTGSPAGNPGGAWAGRALLGWRAVEINNYQRVHRRGVLQDASVLNFPWKLRERYLVEREGEVHISNFLHVNYKLGLYPSWHFFSLWVANTTLWVTQGPCRQTWIFYQANTQPFVVHLQRNKENVVNQQEVVR